MQKITTQKIQFLLNTIAENKLEQDQLILQVLAEIKAAKK